MKKTKTKLMSTILAAAAVLTALLFTSTTAEASNRRIVGHASCGAPIYAVYTFVGYNSCHQRVFQWVTQQHRCSSSCSHRPAQVHRHPSIHSSHSTHLLRPRSTFFQRSYQTRPNYRSRGSSYGRSYGSSSYGRSSSGCRIR